MISCMFNRHQGMITISGHAGFAPKGTDIVCAGVSAIEMALAKWMEKKSLEGLECTVIMGKDETDCFMSRDLRALEPMEMAWGGLCAIAELYPDNCACFG